MENLANALGVQTPQPQEQTVQDVLPTQTVDQIPAVTPVATSVQQEPVTTVPTSTPVSSQETTPTPSVPTIDKKDIEEIKKENKADGEELKKKVLQSKDDEIVAQVMDELLSENTKFEIEAKRHQKAAEYREAEATRLQEATQKMSMEMSKVDEDFKPILKYRQEYLSNRDENNTQRYLMELAREIASITWEDYRNIVNATTQKSLSAVAAMSKPSMASVWFTQQKERVIPVGVISRPWWTRF